MAAKIWQTPSMKTWRFLVGGDHGGADAPAAEIDAQLAAVDEAPAAETLWPSNSSWIPDPDRRH
jgi:hypothetical protein